MSQHEEYFFRGLISLVTAIVAGLAGGLLRLWKTTVSRGEIEKMIEASNSRESVAVDKSIQAIAARMDRADTKFDKLFAKIEETAEDVALIKGRLGCVDKGRKR